MIPHSKPWINQDDIASITAVSLSGMIASGSKYTELENSLNYLNNAANLVCGSGTESLVLALLTLEIGREDEVILPSYVCEAVSRAVCAVDAVPVICDVSDGWLMTPDDVKPCLSPRTKAIVVVHIFGICADTERFLEFDIPVIEDCCQAISLPGEDQAPGTTGTFGFYSFHATKCLTTGEGGALFSKDNNLIDKARHIQQQGIICSKLSDLQASLGISQIKRYEEFLVRRKTIAATYFEQLPSDLTRRLKQYQSRSMFFRFPLELNCQDIEGAIMKLAALGVNARRGVDALLHRRYGLDDRDFSGSTACFNSTLTIPIYPSLKPEEQELIIRCVNEALICKRY